MDAKVRVLLLVGLGVLGIYVIPSAVAKFSGSHTWEFNETSGVSGINCVKCHEYIRSELNASTTEEQVLAAHTAAAGNLSYAQGWLNLSIDNSTSFGVCQLCHLIQNSSTPSHTKVTIRACIDLDCHGDNVNTNNTAYPEGRFGPKLGGSDEFSPTNVHMRIFNQMSADLDSGYRNETGSEYSKGFWFCVGCHTRTEFTLVQEGTENFNHTNVSAAKRRYL
jgi:hypothetical protein